MSSADLGNPRSLKFLTFCRRALTNCHPTLLDSRSPPVPTLIATPFRPHPASSPLTYSLCVLRPGGSPFDLLPQTKSSRRLSCSPWEKLPKIAPRAHSQIAARKAPQKLLLFVAQRHPKVPKKLLERRALWWLPPDPQTRLPAAHRA